MTIQFRKRVVWTGTDLKCLNKWVEKSNYDILKNIKSLKSFDSVVLQSQVSMGIRTFLKSITKFEYNNPQSINYWIERGWSVEYANSKKDNIRKLQSKGIINKIPKEKRIENAKRANKVRVTQIKELQKSGKYNITNPTNIEYYVNKGMTQEESKIALKERQSTFSKQKMIDKYGEVDGLKKVKKRNDTWIESLKENNDRCELSKKKAITLHKMIDKYGELDGLNKYNNWKRLVAQSKSNFISRYGEDEGIEKYQCMIEKRGLSNNNFTSKESIICFSPILELLDIHNIDYYIGIPGNKEYFLKDKNHIYFYDLTIPILNKIVEYNGIVFHPRKSWSEVKWLSWVMPYKNIKADEKFDWDRNKIQIAKNNGFELLEVWSEDPVSEIRNQILTFLNLDIL